MLPQSIMPMHIKLVSNRDSCYRSMVPMMWGIGLGWIMVGAGVLAGSLAFAHNQYYSLGLVVPAFIFALYLIFNTYNLIRQSTCEYIIEITDHDAAFSKIDHWQKKKTNQSILLADIKYAEYYPYLDSASIIFHTSYSDIEMPLWPMGNHARDAVDFLAGTGVKVIDVQSDEAIPD
jgi:hypothetical protein